MMTTTTMSPPGPDDPAPTLAIAVLTRGDRPAALAALAASVADVDAVERVLLVNGSVVAVDEAPVGWRVERLEDNAGIPGGRNVLLERTTADVVLFLDDDAVVQTPRLGAAVLDRFAADRRLAALSLRIVLPGGNGGQQQHNPRLGRRGEAASGPVTSFLGGAVALRRVAVREAGGYCGEFFMYHEETDLAWRLLDAGWTIQYAADLVLEHPASPPHSRVDGIRLGARNRLWVARRRLPWLLVPVYSALWGAISLARVRSVGQLRALVQGWRDGLAPIPDTRRPMSWRTVWTMTRLGRPPVI
jgi:GT2 family glycosyltransferase